MIGYWLVTPLVAVPVTLLALAVTLWLSRPAPAAVDGERRSRAFGRIAAIGLLLAFAIPELAPLVVSGEPWAYVWWRFPLPLIVGVIALAAQSVLLVIFRVTPEAPVLPVRRRDWWSFSDRRWLIAGGAVVAASVLTCVIAGSNSDWMTLAMPNGGYGTFFGWAYGLPVLAGTLLVAALAVVALDANARPPFVRPETVDAETASRSLLAGVVLRVASVSVLLPLGAALVSIGMTAGGQTGVGIPGVGDFLWGYSFAALADPLMFLGRACQIVAVVALLLMLGGRQRVWRFSRAAKRQAAVAS